MQPRRLILIGIDGLDANLLYSNSASLPNFGRLMQYTGERIQLNSVFPPDSPTAWATIFTGLNPSKHGIISFRDARSSLRAAGYVDCISEIRGRTFWDLASTMKRRCCILFPHSAFPPWPLNGIMVSRTTEADLRKFDLRVYPSNLRLPVSVKDLKPITSYPLDAGAVIEPVKRIIKSETELGLKMLASEKWDIFFIYFTSLDLIEHLFWMYFDKNDPERPREDKYARVIPFFYEYYDREVVGKFLSAMDDGVIMLVFSDHGHAMRPVKVVNINQILADEGYLRTKGRSRMTVSARMRDIARNQFTNHVAKHRSLQKLSSRVLATFPDGMKFYTSSFGVDIERSRAYVADPSGGLKAYSYAGIRIERQGSSENEYERIRESIALLLSKVCDQNGKSIVDWVRKRENLYSGPFLSKYPDILFKLRDDWGVSWQMHQGIFGYSASHRIHSGNHRQESSTFLMYGQGRPPRLRTRMNLEDIAPTILLANGISPTDDFDGRPIFEI